MTIGRKSLTVDTDYVKKLGGYQTDAATAFGDAGATGIADAISTTHGTVCSPTADAMSAMEDAILSAATELKNCSDALATQLDGAASTYDNTAQMWAHRLNG